MRNNLHTKHGMRTLLSAVFASAVVVISALFLLGCGSSTGGGGSGGPFTVTYNKGNAVITNAASQLPPDKKIVTAGTKLILPNRGSLPGDPATYSDTGIYFIGWASESKVTAGSEAFAVTVGRVLGAPGEAIDITKDTVLYAAYVTSVYGNLEAYKAQQVSKVAFNTNYGTDPTALIGDTETGWPATYPTYVAAKQQIAPYTASPIVRAGYPFLGWALTASATGASVYKPGVRFSIGDTVTGGGTINVYAIWGPKSTDLIKITYNKNEIAGSTTTVAGPDYAKNQAQTIIDKPTAWIVATKSFIGWADVASATSAQYRPGDKLTLSGNKTLYAVWALASDSATVSYNYNLNNSNGGWNILYINRLTPSTVPTDSKTYIATDAITLAAAPVIAPAAADNLWKGVFLGWASSATKPAAGWLAGEPYAGGAKPLMSVLPAVAQAAGSPKLITLYAQWQETDFGVVTFDGNVSNAGKGAVITGAAPDDMKAYLNDKIALPSSSMNLGASATMAFYGWGVTANAMQANAVFPGDLFTVTKKFLPSAPTIKTTLYALWGITWDVTLAQHNVGLSGTDTYIWTPRFGAVFGADVRPIRKVAQGLALNLTTGAFADYNASCDAAGYTVQWGTLSGVDWTAIPDQTRFTPTQNTIIYAHFTGKPVTVTFNRNSGEAPPVTLPSDPAIARWGEINGVTIPTAVKNWTKPDDAGYQYGGLAYAAADTSATAVGKTVAIWVTQERETYSATKTLYVFWEGKTYTIAFNRGTGAAGTEPNSVSGTWPAAVTLPANEAVTLTKDGYTFAGWAASGTTTPVTDADTATTGVQWKPAAWAATSTLDAAWTGKPYTITYGLNGGTGTAPANATSTWPAGITLPTTTATAGGYDFAGWLVPGETAPRLAGSVWTPTAYGTGSFALLAKWTGKNYTVAFTGGAGASGTQAPVSATWPDTVTLPTGAAITITKPSLSFGGWATSGSSTAVTDADTSTFGLQWKPDAWAATTTLTALWTVPSYVVTFNLAGGDAPAPADISVVWPNSATLPSATPTRDGYTFSGWLPPDSATALAAGATWKPAAYGPTFEMTASWTGKQYTVNFTANGGTGTLPSPLTATWPNSITIPTNILTKAGYNFLGWSVPGSGLTYYGVQPFKPAAYGTGTSELTVSWEIKIYRVIYEPGNGVGGRLGFGPQKNYGEATILVGNTNSALGPPTDHPTWVFKGWGLSNPPTSADAGVEGASYSPPDSKLRAPAGGRSDVLLFAYWAAP